MKETPNQQIRGGTVESKETLGMSLLSLGKACALLTGVLLAAVLTFDEVHGVFTVFLLMLAAFARSLTETGAALLPLSSEQKVRKVLSLPFYAGMICTLLLAPALWFGDWENEYVIAGRLSLVFAALLGALVCWIRASAYWLTDIDQGNPYFRNKKP